MKRFLRYLFTGELPRAAAGPQSFAGARQPLYRRLPTCGRDGEIVVEMIGSMSQLSPSAGSTELRYDGKISYGR